ncbi:MAG: hypothetical protein LC641_02625 [Spirochaeta sp.]|nr:hypothetical protein [Spirochaeta sp.]
MTAYYWTITTLTTIGYGDITPSGQAQMLFVIPIQLFGVDIARKWSRSTRS